MMRMDERVLAPTSRKHIPMGQEPRQCGKHGEFLSQRWGLEPALLGINPFWTQCPQCDQAMQAEADAQHAAIMGQDPKKARMQAMLNASGIPPRFRDSTIWNWQHPMESQRRIWSWARDYATSCDKLVETGRCGIFAGAPGTGKTHLACGLLRHVLERGGFGLYVTVMGMLGRIKATYDERATETEQQVLAEFERVDMLVIDEVGRELDTAYSAAQFFNVLDMRYRALKPTLLLTNLSKAKLVEFLGDAVVDRMRENGGALLMFDWASQRPTRRREADDA